MQNMQFSRRSGRYNYVAELRYLSSLPQTKEVICQRVDLMYELALRDVPYFADFCKSREAGHFSSSSYSNHFDPNQPRAPAGSPGGGQWVSGGGNLLHDAQLSPAIPRVPGPLGAAAAGVVGAIQLYNYLTSRQAVHPDDEARPIIEFEHREYSPTTQDSAPALAFTRTLTQEETRLACPRLEEVQFRVDRIDAQMRLEYPNLSAQQHGTAVHVRLANEINGFKNPEFVAEVSILKSAAEGYNANYGERGTVRIDILERADPVTACVYDLKTGRAGLSLARSAEIAGEVYKNFAIKPTRIIVTEVRPIK